MDTSTPATEKSADGATALTTRKIALLGSAPSSVHLAPFADPTWEIWGCSPAGIEHSKRVDRWFELHPMSDPTMTPDYIAWMAAQACPVYLIHPTSAIPNGVAYPKDAMLAKYGQYFFTSSLSWMFALALEQNPAEIGLWGVDMAATSEYGQQRPGCHHFMTLAIQRGVKVYVPDESDLHRAPALYGFTSMNPMRKKLEARRAELDRKRAEAAAAYEAKRNEWNFYNGAVDDLDYIINTWVD